MATDTKQQKLIEENRRLAAEVAETREILRALRSGEVDALVGSGNDAVYAVQLIALAIDRAETYLDSLVLLLDRLCRGLGWVYGEAWTAAENRWSLQPTTAWCGTDSDAVRLHESMALLPVPTADESLLQALRSGEPKSLRIDDLRPGDMRDAMRRCGLQTGLALPVMIAGGKVTAVLWLWRKTAGAVDDAVVVQARRILEQAAPFVQRKREEELRRDSLEALRGMVHERSRRLAEMSGLLEQQAERVEQAETRTRDLQADATRSKQTIEQQSGLLRSILDSMADGVIVMDLQGNILHFNPAGRSILGDAPEAVPPERWPQVYGLHRPGTLKLLRREELPLWRAMRGETCDHVEIFVKSEGRPAGLTISMSASPLIHANDTIYGAVAVFQDVTERKRAEVNRIQRVVEQRDALVREVHHRIKNNLAGVIALLQQHTSKHPETREINALLEAQLYTVASMHGLEGRGNSGIQLGSLIRSLSENTQSLFGKQVMVDIAEDRLRYLRLQEADSVPLALALNELLVNAHKHGSREPLEIRAVPDGKGLVIEIANKVGRGRRAPLYSRSR